MKDRAGRKRRLSDAIKRAVAHEIAGKLRERPEVLERLKERPEALARLESLGLLDGTLLDAEAWQEDPVSVLRTAARDLGRAIRERPSVLVDLDVNAREVMALGGEAAPSGLDAPLRDLTVVFTDLVGFTTFTASQGDGEASRLLSAHYASVDELVRTRGGRVVKRLGDGHMVAFDAPEAAVLSTLELIEAAPANLALRAGAHAGRVTPIGTDLIGTVVNLASRVADAADGGESLVTGRVRDGAGELPGVAFGTGRSVVLRGFDEPVAVIPVRRR